MHRSILAPVLAIAMAVFVVSPVAAIDRDGDGLRDFFERKFGVTDPTKRDSDRDGVIDSAEDNDGDRLSNLGEQRWGTDPGKRDTDGDDKSDGAEDKNRNGISNAREQDRRPLPKGMTPTLAKAKADYPSARDNCYSGLGSSALKRCVFGNKTSDTTVAVFGDSHALMWAPAMIRTAASQKWKLVTLYKGGCPSLYVRSKGQYQVDRHRTCRIWREKALAWLNAHPPDLIVLTNSDGYKMVNQSGKVIPADEKPARWKAGLTRMIADLPDASDVLILGDAPENNGNPIKCLLTHRRNMAACAARRQPPAKRPFELVEREVAANTGVEFRTLYGQICTYDPCPLVQGKILMWRDAGHITNTLAKRLTPSMRALLVDVVNGPASATTSVVASGQDVTLAGSSRW